MENLPVLYTVLKIITILLGGLYAPLGVFIGYCLGTKQYRRGFMVLGIQVILSLVDGLIYWYLIEQQRWN